MSKKIYVGNLSWNTTESDLEILFTQFGEVLSLRIITDRDTNRSKGFGFVEMEDDKAAIAAIKANDGLEIDGRNLRVNEAEDRDNRSRNNRRY